eukprot:724207-Pelagomonas_calceolata.AAC.6
MAHRFEICTVCIAAVLMCVCEIEWQGLCMFAPWTGKAPDTHKCLGLGLTLAMYKHVARQHDKVTQAWACREIVKSPAAVSTGCI